MHTIAEVCRSPVAVGEELPLGACLALLRERQVRHLVVVSPAGALVGLIHDFQLLRLCRRDGDRAVPLPEHEGRTARSVAVRADLSVAPERPVVDVLDLLATGWEDAVVVLDGPRPVGIFTLDDVVMLASSGWLTPWWRVSQAMQPASWGLHCRMPVRLAAPILVRERRHHVLVCEGRVLVGATSMRDLVGVDPGRHALLGEVLPEGPMPTVSPDTPLLDAALRLLDLDALCVPVVGAGRRPVGLFTAHGILGALRRTVSVASIRAS